jgi:hypothetical protein
MSPTLCYCLQSLFQHTDVALNDHIQPLDLKL